MQWGGGQTMNEMTPQECAEQLENQEKTLCSRCDNNPCGCHNPKKFCKSIVAISQAATVMCKLAAGELVEVVHARWIKKYDSGSQNYSSDENWYYVCSECGKWDKTPKKYCHCCGALMDGKDDNNAE
jgi:hypothetical protein